MEIFLKGDQIGPVVTVWFTRAFLDGYGLWEPRSAFASIDGRAGEIDPALGLGFLGWPKGREGMTWDLHMNHFALNVLYLL